MPTLSCKAILFDMDGTLVDSTAIGNRIWADWAARHNVDINHILSVHHGRRAIETLEIVAPHLINEEQITWLHQAQEDDVIGLVEIPGAIKFVDSLAPGTWAVVTSAMNRLAEKRMRALDLWRGQPVVSAEMVTAGKPNPACFLMAAEKLGVDPADCLVFEDAPAGLEAGRRAGMRTVALLTTHTREQLTADYFINDYMQVKLEPACGLHMQVSW
jgi:HAD superfamily hydrolase (TIGR01509 family)